MHGLAHRLRLTGCVANGSDGVRIEVQGEADSVERFVSRLQVEAPPLAVVEAAGLHRRGT